MFTAFDIGTEGEAYDRGRAEGFRAGRLAYDFVAGERDELRVERDRLLVRVAELEAVNRGVRAVASLETGWSEHHRNALHRAQLALTELRIGRPLSKGEEITLVND
jgi:hypothetical protein